MQQDQHPIPLIRHRRTHLIKDPLTCLDDRRKEYDSSDVAAQSTVLMPSVNHFSHATTPPLGLAPFVPEPQDISSQSTMHLMQLSGMLRAVRVPQQPISEKDSHAPSSSGLISVAEEWWPNGIQQTGPLPVLNLYGKEPFGRTLPVPTITMPQIKQQPAWKALLSTPAAKITIGLAIGIGLLFLVSRIVNIPTTMQILRENVATPRGILLVFLTGLVFVISLVLRGLRWGLFLRPVGKVGTFKIVQIFLIGTFLNFLLPIRGGEVAKTLILKRIANIPISRSLPTVAMDKALDLMPALFIIAIVPFLGVKMDLEVWLILGLVSSILIGLVFFVALAAWKHSLAIRLIQMLTGILPKALASKIEGFTIGFVDSLLIAASRPKIFIPAILLTAVAVLFEGLFAMFAFWTVGLSISFGTAIFGYTVYNMFYILPTPPGQIGSNEAVGLLVFAKLLHLSAYKVLAMFAFSHPWTALIMCTNGMLCLSALGLTISSAMKVQTAEKPTVFPPREAVQV